MPGVLLALFPVLLLFAPRLAWVALGAAIVMLVSKRLTAARTVARPRSESDASV
jgi:hypothetical protein